jgi:hypothetical protein
MNDDASYGDSSLPCISPKSNASLGGKQRSYLACRGSQAVIYFSHTRTTIYNKKGTGSRDIYCK